MNTDFNLSELFDRYLENDLNILEIQEFELRLKNDKSFADSFRLHKEVDNALIEDDIINFRLQLERIGIKNSELVHSAPMVLTEEFTPEIDKAILEQDIIALRDQLNRIHNSFNEEVISADELLEFAQTDLSNLSDTYKHDSNLSGLIQDIDKAIMQEEVMSLRSKLEKIGEASFSGRKIVTLRRRMITYASSAIAAVFLLVVGGAIFLNQQSSLSLTSERTFARYFQSYDGISNRRGPSEDGKSVIELGIQKYNKGEFADALAVFEACMSDNNSNQTVLLYAGSSALFIGDPDKALRYFDKWDSNAPYYDEVQWYTAGAYLKKNDVTKAKTILAEIASDPGHDYYKKANYVLKSVTK